MSRCEQPDETGVDGVCSVGAGVQPVGTHHPWARGGASPLWFRQEPRSAAGPDRTAASCNHGNQLPGSPPGQRRIKVQPCWGAGRGGGGTGHCGGSAWGLRGTLPGAGLAHPAGAPPSVLGPQVLGVLQVALGPDSEPGKAFTPHTFTWALDFLKKDVHSFL